MELLKLKTMVVVKMVVQWRIYSQAKYLHLSVTTDEFEREEKYKNVDEEEDEDGSKSALIDQVFNHRQVL